MKMVYYFIYATSNRKHFGFPITSRFLKMLPVFSDRSRLASLCVCIGKFNWLLLNGPEFISCEKNGPKLFPAEFPETCTLATIFMGWGTGLIVGYI